MLTESLKMNCSLGQHFFALRNFLTDLLSGSQVFDDSFYHLVFKVFFALLANPIARCRSFSLFLDFCESAQAASNIKL